MIPDILRFFSRILVGATFVLSGFVKAVDPVGGAIKFEDYFQAFQLNWLSVLSMPFSIGLAVVEFLIGILLIFNVFPRKTVITAVVFMVFFTILALALAIFNPVSDCGCFGDAIILTNWQTFWKNIIILAFAAILYISRNQLTSPYGLGRQRIFSFLIIVYIGGIALYSLQHLPLIDFRPYAIGKHIPSGMSIPDDAPQPEYKTTFILEKDGQKQEFTEDEYPYDDSTWVFIDSKTEMISKGYQPPILDFVLQHPNEGDITNQLMDTKTPLFIVVSPVIGKIKENIAMKLAELHQSATQQRYEFFIVTSSTLDEAEQFNALHKTNFNFLQGDETNLKTIIRSNPGMLLIIHGTVAGKWHYRDLPTTDEMEQPLSFSLSQQQNTKTRMMLFGHAVLLALLMIFILKSRKTINENQ